MGSKNKTDASVVNTNPPLEKQNRKKYFQFGVFFDGTGNDMNNNYYKEEKYEGVSAITCNAKEQLSKRNIFREEESLQWNDDGVILAENYSNKEGENANDYSNVALLYKCYNLNPNNHPKKSEYEVYIFKIYVEGPSGFIGGGFGRGFAGVLALLSKIAKDINMKLEGFSDIEITNAEFHFHVFGFSRGATLARMFSTMVLDDDCPKKIISKYEKELRKRIPRDSTTVDFLGVFDTVSSIGFETNNVSDYGLYLHKNVKKAMHLCAADEFRQHFALTDFGNAVDRADISEFFIPGCHTDVGGTYKTGIRQLEIKYQSLILAMEGIIPVFKYNPFKMSTQKPFSRTGKIEEISEDVLKNLGWYSATKGDKLNKIGNEYHITREIKQGYNLLPLNLVLNRASNVIWNGVFKSVPNNISRFTIPEQLHELTKEIQEKINGISSGRKFVFPGNEYNSKEYTKLRQLYINYSAKPMHVVNNPSYDGNVICRNIVSGNKGSNGIVFFSDYEL